ncbi:MAG TPA: heavy metal-responsive transcriptional regulator [Blastocatellia bacterium]|nr:heavy metal-responsive transcriptional regulator [Blastocatellia bacterium]
MRSGELARLAGVSTNTLRHYERIGLLRKPPRSRNGYREYPEAALDRVRLAQRALRVGFTLDELARILKIRDKGGAPCREVRLLAEGKLEEIETRLSQLTDLRDDLRSILGDWDKLLESRARTGRAGLLEALAMSDYPKGEKLSHLAWPRMSRKKEAKESDR